MKKNQIIFIVAFTFISTVSCSQKLTQEKVVELTQTLNNSIAPLFQFELHQNKGYCSIGDFNKTLDVRNSSEIAQNSISKTTKVKPIKTRPYAEPVFWKYNFDRNSSSKVGFRANKHQKIFCTISFKELDTISLKSSLNTYTSAYKTSDAALHRVDWVGDKYISLLLSPKDINNTIELEVIGITVSGKFERNDKKTIAKNYSKVLRKILKREFKKLFESAEMTLLVSKK